MGKKIIAISGEIGWDVWPEDIRKQMNEAKGEDIEFQISSPGGYVYDGLEIFNLIKGYEGGTTARIIGMAASMASYIPLAADKVVAESNAIYMIHNARAYTGGDQNAHEKVAKILRGMSNMLGQEYTAQTGKTKKEVSKLMDDESYFFGAEILEAGFVDEIIQVEEKEEEARDDVVISAMLKVDALNEKLKKSPEKFENINKIAALLPDAGAGQKPGKPNTNQGKPMNEQEFLAFLETNPEAKSFYDSAMGYIKAVDETRPDLSAIGLGDILALAPTAKTEHETALEDSRKEVEAGKLTAENIKNVAGIISSTGYGASIKAAGIKVLTGEKDHSGFEDMVALADETAEQIRSTIASGEQPPDTPGDSSTAEQAKQTNTKTAAASLSAAINNTENKVQ